MVTQKMETQQKKLAVLILNWNGVDLLKRFMPSVYQYNEPYAEIIVVDNNSNDNSIDFLKKNYPDIHRIELDENYGFADGYNKAIREISHEYVVLLNSDVRVSKSWLNAPYKFLEQNANYAACQPKIIDEKNERKFEYAGAAGGYIDFLGYPFCRGRMFDFLEDDKGQYNVTKDVFWASGAALFIRRQQYIEVGGLDASFFAHQEEIDLCWRLGNYNYKIAYIPNSTVYHLGGASLNEINPKKTFLNFRNNLAMMLKNIPLSDMPILWLRLLLDGVAAAKFVTEGKPMHCLAILKAHFSFYGRIPKLLSARKATKKIEPSLQYPKSIIVAYFLKGKKKFSDLDWN